MEIPWTGASSPQPQTHRALKSTARQMIRAAVATSFPAAAEGKQMLLYSRALVAMVTGIALLSQSASRRSCDW